MTAVSARPAAARTPATGFLLCGAAALVATASSSRRSPRSRTAATAGSTPRATPRASRSSSSCRSSSRAPWHQLRAERGLALGAPQPPLARPRVRDRALRPPLRAHALQRGQPPGAEHRDADRRRRRLRVHRGDGGDVERLERARARRAQLEAPPHRRDLLDLVRLHPFSYFGRVARDELFFVPFLAVALAGLALRLYVRFRRRSCRRHRTRRAFSGRPACRGSGSGRRRGRTARGRAPRRSWRSRCSRAS